MQVAKRWASWLVVLAVIGAVGGGAWWWMRGGKSKKASGYETAKVDKGAVTARITATGTVSPLKTVLVGSQVSGRISDIFVDFNSEVKKGDVIAKLDPQLFKAAVEQARANLSAANANVTRAQALATDATKQHERLKTLAERDLVARSEADTAASNAEAARAQVVAARGEVERAQAALHQVELNLAYTTIVSPIDGVVISRSIDVGQTVAASFQAPTLFTIAEDLRKMQVDTNVAEGDVGKLETGMPVTFSVDAYPGKKFQGKVRQIRNAPQTIQNVVTYDAVIDVDNPGLELKPGMTANVTFVHGDRQDVLRVPNAALRFRPPQEWWSKANGGKPDDKKVVWRLEGGVPRPVRIKTGITDGSVTEFVEGGLAEGDVLVTDVAGAAPSGGAAGGQGGGGRGGGGGGSSRPRFGF